jgi:hypothetical protein
MAINGVLGRQALGAGTDDLVYTVPEATFSVVTISVTNRNTQPSTRIYEREGWRYGLEIKFHLALNLFSL